VSKRVRTLGEPEAAALLFVQIEQILLMIRIHLIQGRTARKRGGGKRDRGNPQPVIHGILQAAVEQPHFLDTQRQTATAEY
jgi:hypothetical protein